MGSSRRTVSDPSSSAPPSGSHHKKRPQHKKHPSAPPSQPSGSPALPGVQKLKAALRQTRRLLAKDKLAADVRVATERRLKALEADLAQAEQARLERTLATRYHKAKFFERQKVTRKIAQTKRQLEGRGKGKDGDGDGEEKVLGKKERKKLEARLAALRVDLNYVVHYPKTKKYISLFPPEVRQGERTKKEKAEEEKETSETDRQREEVREWVREQMEAGAFSSEPEVELAKAEGKKVTATSTEYKSTKTKDSPEDGKSRHAVQGGLADDDFFATDEDDEGEQGKAGVDGSEEDSEEEEDSEMDED